MTLENKGFPPVRIYSFSEIFGLVQEVLIPGPLSQLFMSHLIDSLVNVLDDMGLVYDGAAVDEVIVDALLEAKRHVTGDNHKNSPSRQYIPYQQQGRSFCALFVVPIDSMTKWLWYSSLNVLVIHTTKKPPP